MPAASWPRCCRACRPSDGQRRGVLMAEDAEDAAFLVELVVVAVGSVVSSSSLRSRPPSASVVRQRLDIWGRSGARAAAGVRRIELVVPPAPSLSDGVMPCRSVVIGGAGVVGAPVSASARAGGWSPASARRRRPCGRAARLRIVVLRHPPAAAAIELLRRYRRAAARDSASVTQAGGLRHQPVEEQQRDDDQQDAAHRAIEEAERAVERADRGCR